jgi:hypothetical protein
MHYPFVDPQTMCFFLDEHNNYLIDDPDVLANPEDKELLKTFLLKKVEEYRAYIDRLIKHTSVLENYLLTMEK